MKIVMFRYNIKDIPNSINIEYIEDLEQYYKTNKDIILTILDTKYDDLNIFAKKYKLKIYDITHILKYIPIDIIKQDDIKYTYIFNDVKPQNRFFDILLSLILLIIFSPIILITQLQILINDGIPIFFIQDRIGLNHKPVKLYKFRSMKVTNDNTPKYAIDEQHRITKVGKFIRKTRIDEIPQLFNVLIGNMSLIGPRPEQIWFGQQIEKEIPEYAYRFNVKPGITGWAQTNWKYTFTQEDTLRKLEYDFYYLKNKSFKLSIKILFKTILIMIGQKGM